MLAALSSEEPDRKCQHLSLTPASPPLQMRCHLSISHLDLVNVLTRQFPDILEAVAQARWAEKRNAGRDPLGEEKVRQQPQCLGGSEGLADRLYQPLGYPGPQLPGETWGWHGLLSTNNEMS